MKPIRLILLFILITIAGSVLAQAPQRFNYQAVARDASGNPISDKSISVQIAILEGSQNGSAIYAEQFTVQTGKQGLFSLQVGSGNVVTGAFSSIVWNATPKFLKVDIDPAGGTSYSTLGTSQLLSVPYALAADKLVSPMAIADLSDVSDTQPQVNQVLKWDGTTWSPGEGSSTLVTSTAFTGNGSTASPLALAQQSATSGQVLQWNGNDWKPATISGGVGDNWGTQVVSVNSTLSGLGTSASPLGIATSGATNGNVLKFNGTQWLPAADGGDNWGTAKVNSSAQFDGDGTPGNPLKLAQNSATSGQVLKWSGTSWIPGDGGSGSLTLPASASVSDAGAGLQIQNNTGTGIVGINANATTANAYGIQGRVLTSTGANTAGVFGLHGSTGTNGYGVLGQHSGNGIGVSGEATGTSGIGVNGKATGSSGIAMFGGSTGATGTGVVGLGATGVNGTTNTAAGKGIYGNATAGGYAGWFDERVYIAANSSSSKPTLNLNENETSDRARLRFTNNVVGQYWDIAAFNSTGGITQDRFGITSGTHGEVLTITGDGLIGIGQVNPDHLLDINGNVEIAGTIYANGAPGNSGQVLSNNGNKVVWASSTNALYNNTYLFDQDATTLSNVSNLGNTMSGLNNMIISINGPAKVIFTFSHSQLISNGSGDVDLQIEMGFINATTGAVVNKAVMKDVILNNKTKSFSYTHHCGFNAAGTFWPYVYVGTNNGGHFNVLGSSGSSTGQVQVQVIHQ